MAPEEISLEMSEQVRKASEEWGVKDEQIKQVIQNAEATGEKLYQTGTDRYLAKLRIKEPTFYVEYSTKEDGYIVHSTYWHYSEIKE